MRRFITGTTALALALSVAIGIAAPAPAAAAAYDSSYQFESAFLSLNAGDSGTFSVFFANTGTTSWVKGTSSQVNLATCLDDKTTCNVAPEEAAFASGWLSATAYATHTKDTVVPGDFSAFTYNIKVPAAQAAGTFRFNGDLVVSSTLAKVHPEGYYQDAKVGGAAAAGITVTPAFPSANDAMNFTSDSGIPGQGQHTVTFNAPSLAGQTLSFVIIDSGNVTQNADGTYGFCDTNQDKKADLRTDGTVAFTSINGVAQTASSSLVNVVIPADGKIVLVIDSNTRNRRVRVIGWQDKLSNNTQVELTAAGDVNCDAFTPYDTNDGLIAVSGRKFWTGPLGTFGAQFPDVNGNAGCVPVWRFSSTLNMFTAGQLFPFGSTSTSNAVTLRYLMDANDIYRIQGTPVTQAQFKAALSPSSSGTLDKVTINFNPDPAGTSEFNICVNAGAAAPSDLSAATGNFDSGATAEDVRLSFTAPSGNAITVYPVQRSFLGALVVADGVNCLNAGAPTTGPSGTPADSTFITVGSTTQPAGEQATFTNFDLANGGYCFRVRTQDPNTGVFSYSNYVPVNIPGVSDTIAPLSTSATLSTSSGFANALDTGDKLIITFDSQMSIAANAVIRVTDSDCGQWNPGAPPVIPPFQGSVPPLGCSGGQTNTVADIICGTNATCTLSTDKLTLTVLMSGNPTIVAAGSVAGVQFNVLVTDSQGITDLSGNTWDLANSPDRIIGP